MAKLLCERPRLAGGRVRQVRDRRTAPPEDGPRQESIGLKWRNRAKMLNENLAPLRRFLRSRVGRLWDDVYSELREHIRFDSAIQLHILQHLWDSVVRDVVLIDGVPCHGSNSSWGRCVGRPLCESMLRLRMVLYVHPLSGLLLEVKPKREKKKRKPQPRHRPSLPGIRTLPDGRQLHRIEGCWYAVELASIREEAPPEADVLLGPLGRPFWQYRDRLAQRYQRPGVYGVRAEQLSPKAIRKLGLE